MLCCAAIDLHKNPTILTFPMLFSNRLTYKPDETYISDVVQQLHFRCCAAIDLHKNPTILTFPMLFSNRLTYKPDETYISDVVQQ